MKMPRRFRDWKDRTDGLNFLTQDIANWTAQQLRSSPAPHRVLDIGIGTGRDLLAVRTAVGESVELYGIETQPELIERARANGIRVFTVNMEREPIPAADEFFDVVSANHVIEHTKELFWIFGEVSRVLKKGGLAIIGCPNLAAWHNRLALLLGSQPPCLRILGPHVRGITRSGFKEFIEYGGYFVLERAVGSNFHLLPEIPNRIAGRIVPGLCAAMHFLIRRTEKSGSFLDVLDTGIWGIMDTPYFRGPVDKRA